MKTYPPDRSASYRSIPRARSPVCLGNLWTWAAVLALSVGLARAQQPANNHFSAAAVISGASGEAAGTNAGATSETGEPDHAENPAEASIWWRWTAPESGEVAFDTLGSSFDTVLAVYTGSTLASLIPIEENDQAGFVSQSLAIFSAVAGTTYRIAVDGYAGATGSVVLHWWTPLHNDHFDNSSVLDGAEGVRGGDNTEATREPGEPDHDNNPGGASLWWRWEAPDDGVVVFNTIGSDFDTVLAVYTGDEIGSLALVASNDEFGEVIVTGSLVSFTAVAGTVYRIAVDGYGLGFGVEPSMGTVILNWGPALRNDAFKGAVALTGLAGHTTGHNIGATAEPGEPDHLEDQAWASVWWVWTAPSAEVPVVFGTIGSDFDTVMAVYTGTSFSDLTLVVDNDDLDEVTLQSLVGFWPAAGTTYWIMVDGFDGATGRITLTWSSPSAAPEKAPTIGEVSRLPDGSFRFMVSGPPGTTGTLQRGSTPNALEDWMPFTLVGGILEIVDRETSTKPAQYYRAVSP